MEDHHNLDLQASSQLIDEFLGSDDGANSDFDQHELPEP
jgi:hypothetical protein